MTDDCLARAHKLVFDDSASYISLRNEIKVSENGNVVSICRVISFLLLHADM